MSKLERRIAVTVVSIDTSSPNRVGIEKAGVGVDQRMTGEIVSLEILMLGHAERALEQRRGRGVEKRQVARIKDDAGRVAVAPLDANLRAC